MKHPLKQFIKYLVGLKKKTKKNTKLSFLLKPLVTKLYSKELSRLQQTAMNKNEQHTPPNFVNKPKLQ